MSISIQGANPAISALETLALQQHGGTAAGSSAAASAAANAKADSGAAILDVSGGAAAAASLDGISGILGSASAADVAVGAGGVVESLLGQMRQDALSAADPSASSDTRATLDAGFQSDLAAISQTVSGASFNGVNLIDGSTGSAGADGATLNGVDLTPTGPLIGLPAGASLNDPASAASLADQLGKAIDNVGQAVGQIASQGQAIATHLSVVAQAGIALQPSLSGSINPGLDADGARLAALQVQQQLTTTSSPLASNTPQAILALFR
jgi:flagellin